MSLIEIYFIVIVSIKQSYSQNEYPLKEMDRSFQTSSTVVNAA